jgi:hypothetical protein
MEKFSAFIKKFEESIVEGLYIIDLLCFSLKNNVCRNFKQSIDTYRAQRILPPL